MRLVYEKHDEIQIGRRHYLHPTPNANKSDPEDSKENIEITKLPWCTCGILGKPPSRKNNYESARKEPGASTGPFKNHRSYSVALEVVVFGDHSRHSTPLMA